MDGTQADEEDTLQVSQRSAMRYDRGGDAMYHLASALMKSLRAATRTRRCITWPAFWRQEIDHPRACPPRSASEDIGHPPPGGCHCQSLCGRGYAAGPAGGTAALAQAAVLVATAPKSNSTSAGIAAAGQT
ncbi:MAG: hypothetical protein V8R75_10975 [Oscillospiraceae bacterium]